MNKRKFLDLAGVLKQYVKDVNELIAEYTTYKNHYERIYTADICMQEVEKISASTKDRIDSLRKSAKSKTAETFKSLRKELQDWTSETPDTGLLQTLSSLKLMSDSGKEKGIGLSFSELQAFLDKANGNYIATKILSEMAKEAGYIIAFNQVEGFENILNRVESGTNTLLDCYCGENTEGSNLLSNHFINGVDYGPYPIYALAEADNILKQNSDLHLAASIWEKSIPTRVEQRTSLTADEKEYIDGLYEGYNGNISGRTQEILKINPGLRKNLLLHEKYSEFVPVE